MKFPICWVFALRYTVAAEHPNRRQRFRRSKNWPAQKRVRECRRMLLELRGECKQRNPAINGTFVGGVVAAVAGEVPRPGCNQHAHEDSMTGQETTALRRAIGIRLSPG